MVAKSSKKEALIQVEFCDICEQIIKGKVWLLNIIESITAGKTSYSMNEIENYYNEMYSNKKFLESKMICEECKLLMEKIFVYRKGFLEHLLKEIEKSYEKDIKESKQFKKRKE